MRRNKLRELLNEGKPSLGTHIITPWPGIAELVGHSGMFDYIEFVGEYSPFSLDLLDNFGRAIDIFPNMSSMMKVEEQTRGFIATRAIDAGIQNVLFTDCRSAEEVRECVRVVRSETPEAGGIHGCGLRRNVGYVVESCSEAWTKAMDEVVIAIMIEKKGAIENLEEILAVKGVDMVNFGGGDYAISVGKPGQRNNPELLKVQRDMIEMALKKGVPPRVELNSFEEAEPFIEMGVRHFCVGNDLRTLFAWFQQHGESMRKLLNSV